MGLLSNSKAIRRFVGGRKAFFEVVVGPPIPGVIYFGENTAAFPLGSLGNQTNIDFGIRLLGRLGVSTDQAFVDTARQQGQPFHQLTAIVYVELQDSEFDLAAKGLSRSVDRIRTLLSFYTASEHISLIRFNWFEPGRGAAEFLAPRYRGLAPRSELDPINHDFLRRCATEKFDDQQLHYFMEMLKQTYSVDDYQFRIARLFSILEAMAGPIQGQFEKQTGTPSARTAIRFMLGYFLEFDIPRFTILPSREFEFDHIELAGRLRHKIFHGGGELAYGDVPQSLRSGVDLVKLRPDMIAHQLRKDCERELHKWVLGESRAWQANTGTEFTIPSRNANYDGTALTKPLITSHPPLPSPIASVFVQIAGPDAALVRLDLRI